MRTRARYRRHEGLREAAQFMAALWIGARGTDWHGASDDDWWQADLHHWRGRSPYRSRIGVWCDEQGVVTTGHPSRPFDPRRWSGFELGAIASRAC